MKRVNSGLGENKGLVTNYGDGPREVLPLRKRGGGGNKFSHAGEGAQHVLG